MNQTFFPEELRAVLPPLGGIKPEDFNEDNLRWPIEYLNFIGPSNLTYTDPVLALFVDRITYELIAKSDEYELDLLARNLLLQLNPAFEDESSIEAEYFWTNVINATSAGNIAFIALYCQKESTRQLAREYLDKLRVNYIKWSIFRHEVTVSEKMKSVLGIEK